MTKLQWVTNTRSDWTAGAGLEYMWAPNFSAKAEYDFLEFGTRDLGFGALRAAIDVSTHVQFKMRCNYRWLVGTSAGCDRTHMQVQA